MAYFTKQSLRRYADAHRNDYAVKTILRKAMTDSRKALVFLSHSHADAQDVTAEDIENARVLLASQGVDVYIDWLDPSMPSTTSVATADRIKAKIAECDRFVVIATNNAIMSRWVPWELGYADHAKSVKRIAVLPLAANSGDWNGSEYLGLYARIEPAEGGSVGVFPPGARTGIPLNSWLS